jgi:hypothetical protein
MSDGAVRGRSVGGTESFPAVLDPRWALRVGYSIARCPWPVVEEQLVAAFGEGAEPVTAARWMLLALDRIEARLLSDPAGPWRATQVRRAILRARRRRSREDADRAAWELARIRHRARAEAAGVRPAATSGGAEVASMRSRRRRSAE